MSGSGMTLNPIKQFKMVTHPFKDNNWAKLLAMYAAGFGGSAALGAGTGSLSGMFSPGAAAGPAAGAELASPLASGGSLLAQGGGAAFGGGSGMPWGKMATMLGQKMQQDSGGNSGGAPPMPGGGNQNQSFIPQFGLSQNGQAPSGQMNLGLLLSALDPNEREQLMQQFRSGKFG